MSSTERRAGRIVVAGGVEMERNGPTTFGAFTPPSGDEVRRYYARREADRRRHQPVIPRIARQVTEMFRSYVRPAG
jgi:hypothetical protein